MNLSSILPFDQTLIEAIKDMVFIVSVEENSIFKYEFFNQAVVERTHLTQNELTKTFHEAHSQATADLLKLQYTQALATRKKVSYEDSYVSPAGDHYYSETVLTPLFDASGQCTYIIGVVKDVTNERLAKLESAVAWERLKESRSRYRSLYENSADAIFSLDLNGRILDGNGSVEHVTAYPLVELIDSTFVEHLSQKDFELISVYFHMALDGISNDFQTKFLGRSGQLIGVLINFAPVKVKKEIVGIYAVMKDMREMDQLISQYVESENRFRIIAENSQDVIVLMDSKGETLYVSPSSKRVYGFDPAEYIGKLPYHNVHPADIPLLRKTFSLAIQENESYLLEVRIKHKEVGWVWTEVKGTPIFDDQHQFVHMLMITRDITLQKEQETQLYHYAYHDSLTGLPNRRFLKDHLLTKIKQCQKKDEVLAVVLLDIDHFKDINDRLGHEVGDAVIEEFGKRLSQKISEQDIAARLGGDEFVLLLPGIKTQEQAKNMATEIQLAMKDVWLIENGPAEVTASIGIALTPLFGSTVSAILKNADLAMYESKEAGRSTFRIHMHE
ncbi:diguanylate cyclase domain-containing protein [Planococcus sp. SE5232]|uniref:sensor domain-containing protein n=1 Tax=unclassified Planococcus (in: firmicutes) TaxID=2662419 RepID=UPI003D6AE302